MELQIDPDSVLDETLAFLQTPLGIAALTMAVLLYAFAWCRVFAKAGFHASFGILMVVPPILFIMPLWLGFAPWPVDRELRGLRRVQKAVHKADERHQKFVKAA